MHSKLSLLAAVLVAAALTGCASTVSHPAASAPATTAVEKVVVSAANPLVDAKISLSDEAAKQVLTNPQFNSGVLLDRVRDVLKSKDVFQKTPTGPGPTLEVKVTGVRVRGAFSAVMWGFMAGADSISGEVTVRDPDGKVFDTFTVKVSYALGGFAGGQDSTRMEWLYEKFAEDVANEFVKPAPTAKR